MTAFFLCPRGLYCCASAAMMQTDFSRLCLILCNLVHVSGSNVIAGAKEELQPTAERGQQKAYETAGVAQDKAKSAGNAVAANFSKLGGEHCQVPTASGRNAKDLLQPQLSRSLYVENSQQFGGLRHSQPLCISVMRSAMSPVVMALLLHQLQWCDGNMSLTCDTSSFSRLMGHVLQDEGLPWPAALFDCWTDLLHPQQGAAVLYVMGHCILAQLGCCCCTHYPST